MSMACVFVFVCVAVAVAVKTMGTVVIVHTVVTQMGSCIERVHVQ